MRGRELLIVAAGAGAGLAIGAALSRRNGEAERVLSAPANVLARFHGLFPGVTGDLMGLVAKYLLP